MAKKFLKIVKKRKFDEYLIKGRGGVIGQIAKGEIFKKRFVLHPAYYEHTEWTSECLRQIADKLDELKSR